MLLALSKSVRLRLLILALLPLIVLLPLFLGVAMVRWAHKFDDLLISKVASDLQIAQQYLQRIIKVRGDEISALARSVEFQQASRTDDPSFKNYLEANRKRLGLDFLFLRTMSEARDSRLNSAVIARAIIPLIATKAAVATDRLQETRGMVLHSAVRVITIKTDAILIGGVLLNKNLHFIDTINDLVYKKKDGRNAPQGTATLFLDDVRISTNVRLFENVRALGTRVSAIVRRTVLDEGKVWLDRAFVVNDWYISGYQPIIDSRGKHIGMLYVGFLEQPYQLTKYATFFAVFLAFIAVIAVSIPVFLWLARGVFEPLSQMIETMQKVEHGNLEARIGEINSKDEIGQVANHLDQLLDQVQDRDQKLRDWTDELNSRVAKRTNELRDTNKKLETTFRQLVMSEKLASIGEITAGVAHEINNPVAVIQGNLDVVRQTLGNQAGIVRTELDLIDDQIHRINVIVHKLLQFARPDIDADFAEMVQMEKVVEDCLVLVQNSMAKYNITISKKLSRCPGVHINRSELQQVVINLMINATQAMADGGQLSLLVRTQNHNNTAGVEAHISDTGPGIADEIRDQIFDPFFTTRQGNGTGLGLSISQALIQRAGGLISVKSSKNGGSKFIIWLPQMDNLSS